MGLASFSSSQSHKVSFTLLASLPSSSSPSSSSSSVSAIVASVRNACCASLDPNHEHDASGSIYILPQSHADVKAMCFREANALVTGSCPMLDISVSPPWPACFPHVVAPPRSAEGVAARRWWMVPSYQCVMLLCKSFIKVMEHHNFGIDMLPPVHDARHQPTQHLETRKIGGTVDMHTHSLES